MSYDKISSGINSQEKGFNRILEEAASESQRISLAIQKFARTTSCKGVQIFGLISLWFLNFSYIPKEVHVPILLGIPLLQYLHQGN